MSFEEWLEEVQDEILNEVDCRELAEKILQRDPRAHGPRVYLCPAHPDTRAGSFAVSEKGCNCFACGYKAGAVRLVRTVKNCGFMQAVSFLSEEFDFHLPTKPEFKADAGSAGGREKPMPQLILQKDEIEALMIADTDLLKTYFDDDPKECERYLNDRCVSIIKVLRKIPRDHNDLAVAVGQHIAVLKKVMNKLKWASEEERIRLRITN